MAGQLKVWTLNSYTPAASNDFIVDSGTTGTVVKSILISNVSNGDSAVSLIVTDSGDTPLFTLLPDVVISAGAAPSSLSLSSLVLVSGQKVRAVAYSTGIEFYASGAEN